MTNLLERSRVTGRSSTRRAVGVIAALVAASMLAACGTGPAAPTKRSITIAAAEGINGTYDPFAGAQLLSPDGQAVYDPLLMVDSLGVEPKPWLAESYEIATDGYSITFELRQDVDFVDGTHFDAPGLEKYLDALFADPDAAFTGSVEQSGTEVTATGEYTLEIAFSKLPISDRWLSDFTFFVPIASPATVGVEGAFDEGPVGSGPYLITDQVAGVSVSFERNPDYWNPEAYPYDEVTIAIYADPIAVLNAVKTGQLDAGQITLELAAEAEASGLNLTEGWGRSGSLYVLDHAGAIVPALGDKQVRQAMAMAFDRATILEELNHGYGYVSSQPLAAGQAGYVEGGDDRYGYDLDEAKSLLAEAGYPDGFDVTILSFGGSPAVVNTTALEPVVQTSLAEIGINVTYETYAGELGTYIVEVIGGATYPIVMWQMAQHNWIGALDFTWPPHGDEGLAELIRQSKEGNPEEQAEAFSEIGEFLLEESWYIPFSRPAGVIVSSPDVDVSVSGYTLVPKLYQYTPAE